MDMRSSVLIVAIYCGLSVTAVLLVVTGYHLYVRPSAESQIRSLAGNPLERRGPTAQESALRRAQQRQAFQNALRRIEELRRLLDKKDALLRDKSQLLDKRTKEYLELKKETDQYFGLVVDMVAPRSWVGTGVTGAEQQDQATASLAEIGRLRQESTGNDVVDQTLEAALVQAEWELQQAYAEIARTQSATVAQLQTNVQSAAENVLVEIGEPAIGPLSRALADERVEVRRWAAVMLGQIGAHAIEATDALITATRDEDEGVRSAARQALVQIENDF